MGRWLNDSDTKSGLLAKLRGELHANCQLGAMVLHLEANLPEHFASIGAPTAPAPTSACATLPPSPTKKKRSQMDDGMLAEGMLRA